MQYFFSDWGSYLIVRVGESGKDHNKTILFNYETSRSAETIRPYFNGFQGHIVSDGLMVYKSILDTAAGVVHGGCWSHAKRKFTEAAKGKKKSSSSPVGQFVSLIDQLFRIERELKGKPPDKVKEVRQEKSQELVDEIEKLMTDWLVKVPKKSLTGKALNYLSNQWAHLTRFLDHPELPIHNNWVEQQIRPIATGRRAWLFADTVEGAEASAIFYSLLMTAKENGLDPYEYLCRVFSNIDSTSDLSSLLPYR